MPMSPRGTGTPSWQPQSPLLWIVAGETSEEIEQSQSEGVER